MILAPESEAAISLRRSQRALSRLFLFYARNDSALAWRQRAVERLYHAGFHMAGPPKATLSFTKANMPQTEKVLRQALAWYLDRFVARSAAKKWTDAESIRLYARDDLIHFGCLPDFADDLTSALRGSPWPMRNYDLRWACFAATYRLLGDLERRGMDPDDVEKVSVLLPPEDIARLALTIDVMADVQERPTFVTGPNLNIDYALAV